MADFKGTWEKAAEKRAAFYEGRHDKKARKEAIARVLDTLSDSRKRR